jgi:hypothetical protein
VEKLKTFRELGTAYSFCAFLFEVVKFQRCACERKRNQWVSTAQKNPPVDKPAHAGALAAYSTGVGQDIKGQPILSEVGPRLVAGSGLCDVVYTCKNCGAITTRIIKIEK